MYITIEDLSYEPLTQCLSKPIFLQDLMYQPRAAILLPTDGKVSEPVVCDPIKVYNPNLMHLWLNPGGICKEHQKNELPVTIEEATYQGLWQPRDVVVCNEM